MTKTTDADHLFCVLLVEDDPALNWGLTQHIQRALTGVRVLQAETVEEAFRMLEESNPRIPDVAIQDIRVPRRPGESPVASTDVTERLKQLRIPSLFMTSYASSDDVKDFIKEVRLTDPSIGIILKNEVASLKDNVLRQLRDLFFQIASADISQRMNTLFQVPDRDSGHTRTASLLTLTRDIARYWRYINEATRQQLFGRFEIQLDNDEVVNLRLAPFGHS